MNFIDLIEKKKRGQRLSQEEIDFFVQGVKEESLPDYQISALLMAIYFQGMEKKELAQLTLAMAQSGDQLSFPSIKGKIVDKHSSGGVGDKTSLIIAPIVSACGLPIAKLSGRGLGFTGGTIDKLESIPGFRTELSEEEFMRFVEKDGISLIGQSADIAPVDKVLYALRDVTATVDSIPLIAASIMSKKLADGSDAIVLDVKYGSGAFMKTPEEAIHLAQVMVQIGEENGKKTLALVTDMNQPLGSAVGNALEVKEAIAALHGQGPQDLQTECLALSSAMLIAGEKAKNQEEATTLVEDALVSGRAFEKLRRMVENQGGDLSYIDHPEKFPETAFLLEGEARERGFVSAINTEEIGKSSLILGAGRRTKEDAIDPQVGLEILKKPGDFVQAGEVLFRIHANAKTKGEEAKATALAAYRFSKDPQEKSHNPVYARVFSDRVERL